MNIESTLTAIRKILEEELKNRKNRESIDWEILEKGVREVHKLLQLLSGKPSFHLYNDGMGQVTSDVFYMGDRKGWFYNWDDLSSLVKILQLVLNKYGS